MISLCWGNGYLNFFCLFHTYSPVYSFGMASHSGPGIQYISDIANAATLTDSREFNAFCVEELQTAKGFIQKNLSYITLDTVLFHVYFVLEYRIEHTNVSINDTLVETAFDFLDTFVPAYAQAFRDNEKNCLHRSLSLLVFVLTITCSCVSYLDNGEKLRMPKSLSENALLSILKCLQSLLTTLDSKAISSLLSLLSTPAEEKDVPRWVTTSLLPVLPSSPSLKYLQSDSFRSLFTILISNLNSLLSHASHEIGYRTLCCIELLLLTTGDCHILPAIPSLLSTLSIQVRVDSLMTWRERTLILLLFGHTLSLLPSSSNTPKTPSISEVVSEWFFKSSIPSTPPEQRKSEAPPTQGEHETLHAFQTRRVLSELPQRVPPLLSNLLECCIASPHVNVQLALLHACFLLIPVATRFFDSSVTLCCDTLIHALYHSSPLVQCTAHTLSQAVFHTMSASPEGRHVLIMHMASLLLGLPSALCLQREHDGLRSIRTVRGYFAMLAAPLTEILTLQDDSFTQLRSFYDTLKQCVQIDSIATVAVRVAPDVVNFVDEVGVVDETACSVNVVDETACSVKAVDETACSVKAADETACSVKAVDETACSVKAADETACSVKAVDETACSVKADDDVTNTFAHATQIYRLTHHFLTEEEAVELQGCLKEVFADCGEMYTELCLWLLTDCLDGSLEAAFLLPIILRHDTPATHEVISSLLEFLHRTTNHPPNARLLLHTLTGIIIAIDSVTTYQTSLLFSLFFYRSLDPHDGLITHSLLRLCQYYHLDSIEQLAANNSDYLMDAVLIQLRVATTLRNNAVEEQLSFLAAVWRDKTAVDPNDSSLFPFAQDSVRICTGLLAAKPLHVLQVFTPIVGLLLHTVPNQTQEPSTLVERFFKRREFYYDDETPSQEVILLRQILSQVKFYLSSADLRVQHAILSLLLRSLHSRILSNAFPFFSPFLPFMNSLLQSPNSPLFLSSLECALAICSLDAVACQEKITAVLWPAIRNALDDCDDWRRELGNEEQAARLRVGVMQAVCCSYRDSDLFESVSEEMVEWLEGHEQLVSVVSVVSDVSVMSVTQDTSNSNSSNDNSNSSSDNSNSNDDNDNKNNTEGTLFMQWLHCICRYNLSYRAWALETRLTSPNNTSVLSPVCIKHDNKRSAESHPGSTSQCGGSQNSSSRAGTPSNSYSYSLASSTPIHPSARASSRTPQHCRSTWDLPSQSASSGPPSAARAGGSRTGPSRRSSRTTCRSESPTDGKRCCLCLILSCFSHCRGRW